MHPSHKMRMAADWLTRSVVYTVLLILATAVAAAREPAGAPAPPTVAWSDNLNGALARAQNEFKALLVIFTTPECPWCTRFKRETLAEKEVQEALRDFICVDIDTTRDPAAAQRHQIRGVPATLILSGDGRPQWGREGFMDRAAFLTFLDDYRQGGGGLSAGMSAALDGWLRALREKRVEPDQWAEIIGALGDKTGRSTLHPALIAYTPAPRREWVELLGHPKLAVRLGAFELLEELAGSTHGYDPWGAGGANGEALEHWREWAASETGAGGTIFAPLTEGQIQGYIRDLASDDRERSARAVRMLEQAGEGVIPALETWLSGAAPEEEAAGRQVKEVRYFLLLPESLGTERARLAHRLVSGNQDERLRSLEAAARGGTRSLPVLVDFLSDPDPFIREAAVDAVISADRGRAPASLLELLKRERDGAVIHAVVRGAGRLKAASALELAGPFLKHENEDLVVAALASLSRTKSTPSAKAVAECLKHPQWRVRAAALEALARLNVKRMAAEADACLEDADPFVRRTAVATLATLQAKKSADRLSERFLQDDQLKGPVVAALREMDVPLPETFGPALRGKDAEVLLPVLDALGNGAGNAWRLALPFLHHENGDVACAAIRVVARGGGGEAEARRELAKVLRGGTKERMLTVFDVYPPPSDGDAYEYVLDPFASIDFEALAGDGDATSGAEAAGNPLADLFAAFAPGAAPAPTAPAEAVKAEPVALNDLFDAFGPAASPAAAPAPGARAEEDAELLQEALACLEPDRDPALRLAAALSLFAMGNDGGASFLLESLDTCTAEERLKIARRAGRAAGEAAAALRDRLLRDPSADVRRAAVALALTQASNEKALRALLTAVFEPASPLQPVDLLQESYVWYRILRLASARRVLGEAARRALAGTSENPQGDARLILALTLLDACWRSGDQQRMQDYLASENPFVRRAAWLALGRNLRGDFLKQIDIVAQDASEWVRGVVPALGLSSSLGVYFDATTVADGLRSTFSSSSPSRRLEKVFVMTLETLCRDPIPEVRNAAALCLLANREKVEARLLASMLETATDKMSAAEKIGSLLEAVPLGWLREQNPVEMLRLLDNLLALTDQEEEEENDLLKLRRRLAEAAGDGTNAAWTVAWRQDEPRPAWGGAVRSADAATPAGREVRDGSAPPRLVVFFRNPGCRDCERVGTMLRGLAAEARDLTVEVRNIRNPEDARINAALCERFDVPVDDHLTAPAIFCGAGALLKGDITFERLQRLLSRPEALTADWRRLTAAETEEA
ncbi:MAG: thioredoxin fold domain-containing protein, partial [Lentisphaerae bacterium]|nr:thioredoxin fold domain-containing protein [Lentisphaerota bacterium]